MLRVIAEFDYVQIPVGGQHEVALSAASHPSNLLDSHYRHGSSLELQLAAYLNRANNPPVSAAAPASGSIATEEAHGTGSHHPERFAPQ
jgi:hypothetical protein